MASNIYTIIMAGGIGSRFWPQSRIQQPKQFIDILGTGESLMQMTWARAKKFSASDQILVLTNRQYKSIVSDQLPDIVPENILTEPSRNNTAPCIAYAAFKLYQKDPEAIMIILPSDHLILKESIYFERIEAAVDFVTDRDALLTLGIQPTRPDTGYGYIQFHKQGSEPDQDGPQKQRSPVLPVISFKEKPDHEMAERYVATGEFLWNAGIFIWKAKDVIKAFQRYTPALYGIFQAGMPFYNTTGETAFIQENYGLSPNISIDYAVIEKAENVFTIPADIGWSDLGTWASLWSVKDKDENRNVLIQQENMLLSNTEDCIISKDEQKLTVIDGLKDYIVVDQKDVLLVYPKSKEQEIKKVIQQLEQGDANRYL